MVRRKNTAEAYEILLHIAQEKEEERKRSEELAGRGSRKSTAGVSSAASRPPLPGGLLGRGMSRGLDRRPASPLRRPVNELRQDPPGAQRSLGEGRRRGTGFGADEETEWIAGVDSPPETVEKVGATRGVRRSRSSRSAQNKRPKPRTRPRGEVARMTEGDEGPVDWASPGEGPADGEPSGRSPGEVGPGEVGPGEAGPGEAGPTTEADAGDGSRAGPGEAGERETVARTEGEIGGKESPERHEVVVEVVDASGGEVFSGSEEVSGGTASAVTSPGRHTPGTIADDADTAAERVWLLREFPDEDEDEDEDGDGREETEESTGDGSPGEESLGELPSGESEHGEEELAAAVAMPPAVAWTPVTPLSRFVARLRILGRQVLRLKILVLPITRLVRWFMGETATRQLAQSVEIRLSTLIMSTISLIIVLCLIGIWFNSGPRQPIELSGFENLKSSPWGDPPGHDPAGSLPSKGQTSGGPGDAGAGVEGPLWRESSGGPQEPEIRNVEKTEKAAASGKNFNDKNSWLCVRSELADQECGELVKHISSKVMAYLERSVATSRAESSVAWKQPVRVPMRGKPRLFYVAVGPFESNALAVRAMEELKELTRDEPLMFRRKSYFSGTFVLNETAAIAAHRVKLWNSGKVSRRSSSE